MCAKIVKFASTRFGIVKRSRGQSAIDHASYISRSVLVSEYDGQTYRPKYHEDLVHCEISLPENAPEEWRDRAALWNSVERNEKAKNAQLARTLKAALPNDWSYEVAEETVRDYVQRNFVSKGMCADWAIHDSVNPQGIHNLHFHLMLTMRPVDENGKWGAKQRKEYILDKDGNKIRNKSGRGFKSRAVDVNDWNDKGNSKKWRQDLTETINAVNDQVGVKEKWEHRSFKEMGIEQEPTVHLGAAASALERQGIRTEKGDINREITERNRILMEARRAYSRAAIAVRQLEHMAAEQAAAAGNEITRLIDRIMERKGRLYLPLAGAPYFRKMPHRETLLDAGNVKRFAAGQGIESFPALESYAQTQEKSYKETQRRLLSRKEKLRRLKELSSAFASYQPYMEVLKKSHDLKGMKAALYERQHREELETGNRLWGDVKRLLSDGEKFAPRQWKEQIEKLTGECRELSGKSGEYVCRLAFVEVIRYNREMELSEQSREAQGQRQAEPPAAVRETDSGGRNSRGKKPSVLQALHERQAEIKEREEQKQRQREPQAAGKRRGKDVGL